MPMLRHVLPAVDLDDLPRYIAAHLVRRKIDERSRALLRGAQPVHRYGRLHCLQLLCAGVACMNIATWVTLSVSTLCRYSSLYSSILVRPTIPPALLIRTSMRPQAAMDSATIRLTFALRVTSPPTRCASAPNDRTSAATDSAASRLAL